jgi:hypothetical protein
MLKAKTKPAKRRQPKPRASSTLAKAQAKAKARHERMLAYAKTHRPPQSWFERNDCPFPPTKE